jgi:CDP-glycerol glycerophosphotransferase (TagB/SpsB family)
MGRDLNAPFSQIANTVANLEAADLLLSSGPYMTEVMYGGAFGVTEGVVELGTPRVDRQFGRTADLVLYAPTWQEASYTAAVDDTDALAERIAALASVGNVALRVHGKIAARAAADPRLRPYLIEGDTNELLGRTRVLISDYSSVAFDYLATGSHVLFFTPDPYPRGVYLTDSELPGPRTDSLDQLVAWAAEPPTVDVDPMRARFVPNEDGKATARVVEHLLALGV